MLNEWATRWPIMGSGAGKIQVSGGKICQLVDGMEEYLDNTKSHVLDLANHDLEASRDAVSVVYVFVRD